ncbi:hypothetical protein FOA52_008632 [Chlamydomonas sp. UWO 241]|nr:hypothetical protein FOA52_008632 [Chlamydomonas sp. UWO 241]
MHKRDRCVTYGRGPRWHGYHLSTTDMVLADEGMHEKLLAALQHGAPRLMDPAVPSLSEHGKRCQCFIRMVVGPGLMLLPGNPGKDTWIAAEVTGCRWMLRWDSKKTKGASPQQVVIGGPMASEDALEQTVAGLDDLVGGLGLPVYGHRGVRPLLKHVSFAWVPGPREQHAGRIPGEVLRLGAGHEGKVRKLEYVYGRDRFVWGTPTRVAP